MLFQALASLRPRKLLVVVTYKEVGRSCATGVLDDAALLCPAEKKNVNIKRTEASCWSQGSTCVSVDFHDPFLHQKA